MSSDFSRNDISEAFADAAEQVAPSIVAVHGRRRLPGTGTVWSSEDSGAIVVTASHVVEQEERLSIARPDGTVAPATLLGRDLGRDIAILRTERGNLTPATAREQRARVGTLVLAVGRPGAVPVQASFGVVNAIGHVWFRRRASARFIHADVEMLPGFSGGPLIDANGAVLGINTSGLNVRGGVTVPADQITRIASDIAAYGYVRTGWIGVTVQPVALPPSAQETGETEETDQDVGLLIAGIEPGSPAADAGLIVGDILVSVADQPLTDVGNLQQALGGDQIGSTLTARVLRGGAAQTVTFVPVERPGHGR